MKQRVAIIATCLNLVLCIAFLLMCGMFTCQSLDGSKLSELSRTCRLSALYEDSAAFDRERTIERARELIASSNMVAVIYDKDGAIDYSSKPSLRDALTKEVRAAVAFDTVYTQSRPLAGSEANRLFAYTRLSDDYVLAILSEGHTVSDAMGGKLVPLVLLAILVACITLLINQVAINRTNAFVGEVQRVLEDFSEGQFDSRIQSSVQGDSIEQSAHFNEIMGRIQDRVFNQKTRNQALNTVMNHMQNGILAVDDKLNVILITPAAKHLLNIVGAVEGLPISQASRDVNLDAVLIEAMHQDGVYTNEVAVRSAVGRGHTPMRLYVSPMMKDGHAVGAVALVEDITELRRLEQVRTDFAANVSHELKTPLTSIKGFVETLQNGAIDNPEMSRKFLRIIMVEADRLTRLINDILSISKLESGKDEVPNKRIRLDRMASGVADMLDIQASEKEITIHCRDNSEPSYIMGNPDRVEQMLINLIENAVKYNRPGGTVTVQVNNSGDDVNLLVSDTGIGIAENDMPRLFERFYRVDKGRSRSMGGTGLGLAIVKHLVRTMDGDIEVHSKFGEGTEFFIRLPRVQCLPDDDRNPFEDD